MNFKFLMPLAAGIFPFMAYAVGDVSGLVVNKDTKAPMDFVTVQLLDASTGKPLPIGTNTDEKGYPSLSKMSKTVSISSKSRISAVILRNAS